MQPNVLAIKLLVDAEFVLRYETETPGDGLPEGEGAFLACSFWLVDNCILQGRHAEARKLFDRLFSCCNDVGLLAEEYDPLTRRMLGNFPQAYSHVGLINCALNLSRQSGPTEERALSELSGNAAAMASRSAKHQEWDLPLPRGIGIERSGWLSLIRTEAGRRHAVNLGEGRPSKTASIDAATRGLCLRGHAPALRQPTVTDAFLTQPLSLAGVSKIILAGIGGCRRAGYCCRGGLGNHPRPGSGGCQRAPQGS